MAHILEIYAPTFAAKQKIGKVGSDLPFAAACTKVRYGDIRQFFN
ncbi:MAG: hypothetical protein ACMUJK_01145 [Rhodobacterales bacterium]